ncbi:hypothetical protein HanIR_Chr17g0878591 [Helianthus annuus]|nr:hypothetical protein HanIR_Chr17g0878591 [Helianthus annuus]
MWAALKHSLDILIGRKMNRNSDRVNTLYRSRIQASVCLIVIREYLNVYLEFLRRFSVQNRVPMSAIYTQKLDMLTDCKTIPLRSVRDT